MNGVIPKAAETKGLVPVILKIAELWLDPADARENYMLNLLRQSLLIDTILQERSEDFRLQGVVAETFQSAVLNYNLLTTELRLAFGGRQLFNYTIKQHALSHIALDALELSPRLEI